MKKRTKLLSALTAGVLTLGAMCFGYASWSSEITVNGSVSASGKWDVSVTDASIEISDAGAAIIPNTEEKSLAYNSYDDADTVYNNNFASKNAMNAKVAELEESGAVITSKAYNLNKYQALVSYYDANGDFHNKELIGTYDTTAECDDARNARKEEILAEGGSVNSTARSVVWYFTVEYTSTVENTVVWASDSVTYAPVEFSLPDAWAAYTVTVTNNGTVNANLKDYSFDVTNLDSNIYTVDVPTGFDDEVLAPGASCTFTFVVKVNDSQDDITAESAAFKITLNYEQDSVNAAPSASHSNN